MQRYAGWFIPLKMETGSTEYRKWSKQYKHEGRAIPIVFVVRSDGTQLFGRSGSLPGLELYQLLEGVAPYAGRFFNARELETIQAAVAQARVELDEEGPAAAIRTLRRLKRIGTLGKLGGYAEASLAADRLVGEIETLGRTAIRAIDARVESDGKSLDAALAMVETKAAYGQLDALKADLRRAQKEFKSDPAKRKMLRRRCCWTDFSAARAVWSWPGPG